MNLPGSTPPRPRSGSFALPGLLLALAFSAAPTMGAEPRPAAPNVILIVADDLGWNDVGYHGSEVRTPNLDRLAGSGVKLERHYVFPTCSPTRAALLTGRNPSRFDILGPIDGRSAQSLPPGTATLAEVLRSRGYATAMIGKWHLGLRPDVGPRRYGFDTSYGYLHGQVDPETHRYKNGDRTWHRDDAFVDEPGHPTDLLAEAAVRWIETPRSVPFFLDLAFSVPHTPLREEARWTAPYGDRIADPSRRLYAASVTHMDDAIGRVVAALERVGQRERTLIVFTSDNGGQKDYTPGADYEGRYGPYRALGENRPLRGWKGGLYEGGIRVPAFANWPGTLSPRVVTSTICAVDWSSTLAALAGARVDPRWRWEGIDLWPTLTGAVGPAARRLYWKTDRESAILDGNLKLIVPRRKGGLPELYDVAGDPGETKDLAPLHPDRVSRLLKSLDEERALDP
jgi:arylsulfatase A-like enzyme